MRACICVGLMLLLGGCASRFGHRNPQTLLDIQTVPPRLTYYVLLSDDLAGIVRPSSSGLQVADEARFQKLLSSQLTGLVSNTSLLNYTVGSYVLTVYCPRGVQFQQFNSAPKETTKVVLECR